MIDLYYWTTPNGHKITMFLEEMGLEYKIFPINIGKGEQFTPEFLASGQGWGLDSEVPVFVFGLPRSGTTLVEQILASHSQVHGAGEARSGRRALR